MQETEGFDLAAYRLREFRCETWQGFIYVSLAEDPPPFAGCLDGLEKLIANYRIAAYVPVHEQEDVWDTNWKCLVENFMDAYHIHRVHRNSFAKDGSSEELTKMVAGGNAYACHYVQENAAKHSVHAHPDNNWLQGDDRYRTYLINVFPSHVMQLQPDFLWYLSILPAGIDRVSIRWAVSIPAEILDGAPDRQRAIDDVLTLLHQVNGEDRPIVENVFRSTASPAAVQGPMSWLEQNVRDFGRYLARRLGD
jgi:phenylpropionate dioxygenase-like ring-hydroxylating dioxygenase large terminal subunit